MTRHRRARSLPMVAALAALSVMGALTVTMSASHTGPAGTTVAVADATSRSATPPATPTVASAAPTMKAQPFQGGWIGGGPFKGGGWPPGQ